MNRHDSPDAIIEKEKWGGDDLGKKKTRRQHIRWVSTNTQEGWPKPSTQTRKKESCRAKENVKVARIKEGEVWQAKLLELVDCPKKKTSLK